MTGAALLSITPDGSCDATSCTAAAVGAHTVTSSDAGKTTTSTLTILNVAPVATGDSLTVLENATSTGLAVLGNDTDDNGDTLTVTAVSTPANGTATIDGGGGGVHYTPSPNYSGSDSFTYTVSDGNGGTDTGSVSVTVTHVNQAPSFTMGAPISLARAIESHGSDPRGLGDGIQSWARCRGRRPDGTRLSPFERSHGALQ